MGGETSSFLDAEQYYEREEPSEPPEEDDDGPPGQKIEAGPAPRGPPSSAWWWRGTGDGLIATGSFHSVVLKEDGSVWTFGENTYGQLGTGQTLSRKRPTQIETTNIPAVCVAAGISHTGIILQNGQALVFGLNQTGQIGLREWRVLWPDIMDNISNAIGIACGNSFTVFVLADGTAKVFGNESLSQLANFGVRRGGGVYVLSRFEWPIRAAAAGNAHCLYLLENGTVVAVGSNKYGQLGNGRIGHMEPVFHRFDAAVVSVTAGSDASAVVTADGRVATWGYGANFVLGHSSRENEPLPIFIDGITDAVSVAISRYHTAILHRNGQVSTCGRGSAGQDRGWLGHGDDVEDQPRPQFIAGLGGVSAVSCGEFHTLFRHMDGRISGCGDNRLGQLGLGPEVLQALVPTFIPDYS
jgi:alpha-tubulin suppressor-like RCC1 family protein